MPILIAGDDRPPHLLGSVVIPDGKAATVASAVVSQCREWGVGKVEVGGETGAEVHIVGKGQGNQGGAEVQGGGAQGEGREDGEGSREADGLEETRADGSKGELEGEPADKEQEGPSQEEQRTEQEQGRGPGTDGGKKQAKEMKKPVCTIWDTAASNSGAKNNTKERRGD